MKKSFGAAYANVQPHSGAQANYAAEAVFAKPGDTITGHYPRQRRPPPTVRLRTSASSNVVSYGLDPQTERIDFDDVAAKAEKYQPKLIIAGASAYPRIIDFERFARDAHDNGVALMAVDMAHIAGLVATGRHPSPVPYADVVTSTTHKDPARARGGIILCNDPAISKKINLLGLPGTQGGPLEHVIAGKAVALARRCAPSSPPTDRHSR